MMILKHLKMMRRRGRAQIRWRQRQNKKERWRDEMAALRDKNRVLTRRNEALRMMMESMQRHWDNYERAHPPDTREYDDYE